MDGIFKEYEARLKEEAAVTVKAELEKAYKKKQRKTRAKYQKKIRLLKKDATQKLDNMAIVTKGYMDTVQELVHTKEECEREKEEFIKNERKNAMAVIQSVDKQKLINLNVGGKKFTTTVETLTKYEDSIFPIMLSGKFKDYAFGTRSEDMGEIFIDRDGHAFKYILTFLRNGEYIAPSDPAMQRLVNMEIDYFGLKCLLFKNPDVKLQYYGINNFFPYEAYFTNEFKQIRYLENQLRSSEDTSFDDPDKEFLLDVFDYKFDKMFESSKDPKIKYQEIIASKVENFGMVHNLSKFKERFEAYTNGMFSGFDWTNVCVAGGSVVRCLLNHSDMDKGTDVDLFIYGLPKDESLDKIVKIYNFLQSKSGEVFWLRTVHALTICFKNAKHKHVQIILRLYKDVTDILTTFDLDSCCAAFVNTAVLVTPRFVHALKYQANVVDPKRQSGTYELRLYKYTNLGFGITVPGYSPDGVNPNINLQSFWQTNGLKRLLIMKEYERLTDDGMNATRCECEHKISAHDIHIDLYKRVCRHHKKILEKKKKNGINYGPKSLVCIDNNEKLLEVEAEDPAKFSDYCSTFIPHGVEWRPSRLEDLFNARIRSIVFGKNVNRNVHYMYKICTQKANDIKFFDINTHSMTIWENYDHDPKYTIPKSIDMEEPTIGKVMRGSFQPTDFEYYGECLGTF